jgi:tRNA dimethylallyltransferase
MPDHTKTLYIIAGPTAVGKTTVAIALAKKLGTAIISADSRQCYREMNIGTAKPSPEELRDVKHYFIDELPVAVQFTAADYESLALKYLAELFTDHGTAVVCGGTGLYLKALCEGLDEMPGVNELVVKETENEYTLHGLAWLKATVQQEDPEYYVAGEVHNPARLLRALSFIRSTGSSIIHYRTNTQKQRPFHIIKAGLELPREILYSHINKRVDKMMEQGLLKEAEQLYPWRHLNSLQTVGYAELFDFIDGNYALPEAITKIKQHTRNYAKRQLTWFKKDKTFTWFRADDEDVIEKILLLK